MRSYSRTAYHDKAAKRSNYHLIIGQQVTKILFDKSKRATGVTVRSLYLLSRKSIR